MIEVSERLKGTLLEIAREAALAARELIQSAGEELRLATFNPAGTDPVCQADRIAEAAICRTIARSRPDDGILGEEGAARSSATGLRWVVDAIDGSQNYMYGAPHACISIACEARDQQIWRAVAGVVCDISREEVFMASDSGGAWLNDRRISVNDPVTLDAALIATELSHDREKRAGQAAAATKVLIRARGVRISGSSALDLCWVAAGRLDGFFESDMRRWDWAAAALILAEAGGQTSVLEDGLLASGPALHAELARLIGMREQA
jgi:myo-inositol-1(or 4)-monophosphatase